jgi:hypothetical protein
MDGDTSICSACGRALETGAGYCLHCGMRIAGMPQSRLVSRLQRIFAFIREAGQPFGQYPEKSLQLYRHSPVDHW